MDLLHLAHAGEEHVSESENITHTVTENPLIGILVLTALVLIIGALIIWLIGRTASPPTKHNKKESKNHEPSDS